jgi:hypothetical protein
VATAGVKATKDLSNAAIYLIRLVDDFAKLIDSERVEYLAKVSLKHVKQLSVERSRRIDDALRLITQSAPPPEEFRNDKGISQLIEEIENFFWSDHVIEEGAMDEDSSSTPKPNNSEELQTAQPQRSMDEATPSLEKSPLLRATSTKLRRSVKIRFQDLEEMKKIENEKGSLFIAEEDAEDDSRDNSNVNVGATAVNRKTPAFMSTTLGFIVKVISVALSFYILRQAKVISVQLDGDYALLWGFILFATGFQVSRIRSLREESVADNSLLTTTTKTKSDQSGGVTFSDSVETTKQKAVSSLALLRKSMSSASMNRKALLSVDITAGTAEELLSIGEEEEDYLSPRPLLQSPLAEFPPNGDPESDLNCVSEPKSQIFNVRGPTYLIDRKKVPSEQMLFPFRGADLLLTDECPEHVARCVIGAYESTRVYIVNYKGRLYLMCFLLAFDLHFLFILEILLSSAETYEKSRLSFSTSVYLGVCLSFTLKFQTFSYLSFGRDMNLTILMTCPP